jgi:O-antigen/teichoic acid export membrane protein
VAEWTETPGGTAGAPRVGRDVVANLLGQGWAALWNFGLAPVYARLLGIEAYGLVGMFLALQAVLAVLDLGLTPAMTREMARKSPDPGGAAEVRGLARRFELLSWGVGACVGVVGFVWGPAAFSHWVKGEALTSAQVAVPIRLMALVLLAQWPVGLYAGGLMGLRQQVLLNAINAAVATVRGVGAILVLVYVAPTVTAFFAWHVVIAAVHAAVLRVCCWRALPASADAPRLVRQRVAELVSFAAGMSGIGAVSLLLTQLDKIVLSRLVSLEMFGYYALASLFGGSVQVLISPLARALFPNFSRLTSNADEQALSVMYHKGCQLMSVIVLPVALVGILFSSELLLLWTRDPRVVSQARGAAMVLLGGSALNGLASVPYALQIAHGWTRLALVMGTVQVFLLTPVTYLLALRFGLLGGASVWLLANAMYVLISVPLMHRRLIPGGLRTWAMVDVGGPLLAAGAIAVLGRFLVPMNLLSGWWQVIFVACLGFAALIGAGLAAPLVRARAIWQLRKIGLRRG